MNAIPHILICDDNAADLQLLQMALVEACMAHIHIGIATTAADALETLHAGARQGAVPLLIITDYKMPGMNGPAFLASLKTHEAFRDVPIVLMSGQQSEEAIPHVTEILVKPATWSGYEQIAKHLVSSYLPRSC
jgi:CheY-like chemotaxis protein